MLAKTKKNKIEEEGNMIEILTALDDLGIDNIIEMISEVYNNCKIPEDLSRSSFIIPPKKCR